MLSSTEENRGGWLSDKDVQEMMLRRKGGSSLKTDRDVFFQIFGGFTGCPMKVTGFGPF